MIFVRVVAQLSALAVSFSLLPVLPSGAAPSGGRVVVSDEGGLGRIERHGRVGAVLRRDEGIVTLLDLKGKQPQILGSYDDDASQSLDGDLAFSSDGSHLFYARQTSQYSLDGLHVLDISDPDAPVLSTFHPLGGSYRVAHYADDSGEWVYVLDAIHGLVTFSFEPTSGQVVPVSVDALPALKVGGPASAGIHIDRKDPISGAPLMYVTTGETGLQVYDISTPSSPTVVGEWSGTGLAEVEVVTTKKSRTVMAATEYWFDGSLEPEVVVLDASDLAEITEVDRWSAGGVADGFDSQQIQGMAFHKGRLYVAHSTLGVVAFDGKGKVVARRILPKGKTPGPKAPMDGSSYAMDVEVWGRSLVATDAAYGQIHLLRLASI